MGASRVRLGLGIPFSRTKCQDSQRSGRMPVRTMASSQTPRQDGASEVVAVSDFAEAQSLVPFPVSVPPGRAHEILVRPERGDVWSTVWSTHVTGSATIRVKQFAFDWLEHIGWPVNLWHTGLGEHRWDTYGPTTRLDVGPRSAFHGRDYERNEAGSLVIHTVHSEFRVTSGQLGPEAMAATFKETREALPKVASTLARRPLCLWNWSLRSGGFPLYRRPPTLSRYRWYSTHDLGSEAWGKPLSIPDIPGWAFDSWGVANLPGGNRSSCILLRSSDSHSVMKVTFSEGEPSGGTNAFSPPLSPLFQTTEQRVEGIPVSSFTSPILETSVSRASLPTGVLEVTIPPGFAESRSDEEILTALIRVFH